MEYKSYRKIYKPQTQITVKIDSEIHNFLKKNNYNITTVVNYILEFWYYKKTTTEKPNAVSSQPEAQGQENSMFLGQ